MRVTDHALIRYMERVHGVDFDTMRREIAVIARAGASLAENTESTVKVNVPNHGLQLVLKGDAVVTVIDKKTIDYIPQKRSKQRIPTMPRQLPEVYRT
ncbi:hypothetical protein VSS37_03220 [Candidatus Thiothrix sp. Deng01]|uniref:DUF4258 domain-containing protein n=1 Tax=Candidatus Thiothrix phosphatis TaxID=3112415 RepID=A0ABU6CT40_9GAMM|nr:hypothetical protein [Candidatus Thiothrix sp. Deng01]MEB4589980.1 hypothetical protein [Candidatus Thiothrix sp. Deng01]